MSRADSQQITDTAKGQNATQYGNAQNSYTMAQQDAGDYSAALAKYAAANPYGSGGVFQKTTNQQLTDTADAAAKSAGEAMQSSAVRSGINPGAAIAGTEAVAEANERGLGADEAQQTQARLAADANYRAGVLQSTAVPVQQQTQLAGQQGQLAEGTLSAENQASAANKSFMDQFGGAFATTLGDTLGGKNLKFPGAK